MAKKQTIENNKNEKLALNFLKSQTHIIQTPRWAKFKTSTGLRILEYKGIYLLVKKIPFSNKNIAIAQKVNFNLVDLDFEDLKKFLVKNSIAFIRFDVPNVLNNTQQLIQDKLNKYCIKSIRNTFTQKNILLFLDKTEDELLANMHSKRRYNVRYSTKKGVTTLVESNQKALDTFYKLHTDTAQRQGFLTKNKSYFKNITDTYKQDCYFVQSIYNAEVLTSWLLIYDSETLYYVFGGSSNKHRNFFHSELCGFEAIKLAKKLNCTMFDLWGAEEGKGFTDFKLKFGAELVEFLPSYDFIVNSFYHRQFNFIYEGFWKFQKIKNRLLSFRKK